MSRCTGHCCKRFSLPFSPMELQHQAKRAKIGKSKWNPIEMAKIADMVILIGEFMVGTPHPKARGITKADHRPKYVGVRKTEPRQWHYTCKHFDTASGNCMNYENRPDMCKNYPYTGTCGYTGCTMKCDKKEDCSVETPISPG